MHPFHRREKDFSMSALPMRISFTHIPDPDLEQD